MLGHCDSMKKAFVISFEQLPACMLGCYGHQWIETPNFDRLAACSVLFDQHFTNDLSTDKNSFPLWTGQAIPNAFEAQAKDTVSLISHLKKQGVSTNLLLESDRQIGRSQNQRDLESYFNDFDQVQTTSGKNGFKINEAETPVAQLMQSAIDRLPEWMQNVEDQLIWIRSEGIPVTPLAPEFYSTLYLDEVLDQGDMEDHTDEEIEPLSELDEVPEDSESEIVTEDWQELITVVSELFTSPDEWSELDDQERLMARAVYAGYVTLIDQWFGRLLDKILEYAESQPLLLIVTATRGGNELLGPARQLENPGLFEETTHVPLFVFDSENQQPGSRRQPLSKPADIPISLADWFGVPLENVSCPGNNLFELIDDKQMISEQVVYVASDQAIALRTSEFYYLRLRNNQQEEELDNDSAQNEVSMTQLYQKPMDRWDVYEIHKQLPEIEVQLSAQLDERIKNDD